MKFLNFINSTLGRGLRIVLGVALVIIGSYGGGAWYVVSVIGLVPIVAGAGNFCILKPVLKRSSHAR